jgi:hypothetical protein
MSESENNDDNNKLGKYAQRNNSGTFPPIGFIVSTIKGHRKRAMDITYVIQYVQ